jgi:hypothetical protein
MATKILGKVAVTYKGNYNSSITYDINDEVYDPIGNKEYRSLKSNNTAALTDATSWGITSQGIGVTTDNNFIHSQPLYKKIFWLLYD